MNHNFSKGDNVEETVPYHYGRYTTLTVDSVFKDTVIVRGPNCCLKEFHKADLQDRNCSNQSQLKTW